MTDYLSTLISLTNFTTDDGIMLLPINKDQLEKYKSDTSIENSQLKDDIQKILYEKALSPSISPLLPLSCERFHATP